MNINCTVLIQIVQFLIAYSILERILFRPGIAALVKKDTSRQHEEQMLSQKKEQVDALRLDTLAQWHRYRQSLKRAIPVPHLSIPFAYSAGSLPKEDVVLSNEEKKMLVERFKNALLAKVRL